MYLHKYYWFSRRCCNDDLCVADVELWTWRSLWASFRPWRGSTRLSEIVYLCSGVRVVGIPYWESNRKTVIACDINDFNRIPLDNRFVILGTINVIENTTKYSINFLKMICNIITKKHMKRTNNSYFSVVHRQISTKRTSNLLPFSIWKPPFCEQHLWSTLKIVISSIVVIGKCIMR